MGSGVRMEYDILLEKYNFLKSKFGSCGKCINSKIVYDNYGIFGDITSSYVCKDKDIKNKCINKSEFEYDMKK